MAARKKAKEMPQLHEVLSEHDEDNHKPDDDGSNMVTFPKKLTSKIGGLSLLRMETHPSESTPGCINESNNSFDEANDS